MIESRDGAPPETSVALAFQMRAIPRMSLKERIRALTADEEAELELATDEAIGRVEPVGDTFG
jgi:mRNA-degrading endonuclease toxin of MazEF toxin-antitoxin module